LQRWKEAQASPSLSSKAATAKYSSQSNSSGASASPSKKSKGGKRAKSGGALALSEVLVLGMFVGLGVAAAKLQDQLAGLYKAADKALERIGR
jgi:hypothetical protein